MIYVYTPATIDPNITPTKVGQVWVNTATGHVWISNGTASSANWSDVSASGGSVTFSATDKLLGRASAGAGAAEEIACTAAGRALLDDADATAQIATLFGGSNGTGNVVRANGALFGDGAGALTAGVPGIAFTGATQVGFRRYSTFGAIFTASGADIWYTAASSINMRSNGSFSFSATTDPTGASDINLYRITAGHLGSYNATNAQKFSIANTWTSGTNNELLEHGWTSSVAHSWTVKGSGGGSAREYVLGYDATEKMRIGSAVVSFSVAPKLPSYTVAGVPSASTAGAGAMIYVSNESGGAVVAFSDATDWRRITDRAIIS